MLRMTYCTKKATRPKASAIANPGGGRRSPSCRILASGTVQVICGILQAAAHQRPGVTGQKLFDRAGDDRVDTFLLLILVQYQGALTNVRDLVQIRLEVGFGNDPAAQLRFFEQSTDGASLSVAEKSS